MKVLMKRWTIKALMAICAVAILGAGCASTKNVMNKATFGLIGGSDKADVQEASGGQETKAERNARENEEKQQRRAEKRAAKEDEKARKAAAKKEKLSNEKPGLMSRMTFGLIGGNKSETSSEPEQSPATTESTASPSSAPVEPTKEEKKAQKRAEKERRDAEKQARKDAEKAEVEQAKAHAAQPAEGASGEPPKEKRTLMSRMTFGLIGGNKSEAPQPAAPAESTASIDSTKTNGAQQPSLPPDQLAMAAPADVHYDVQPASELTGTAIKLAKIPFKTTMDYSTKSSTGKGQATASRETYSKDGYGITDLGDVRIAVEGMTFGDDSRAGGVIISSDDRLAAGGKSGTGNSLFNYEYAKGVSAVQFGTVSFTIANSVIAIGGKSVPIGQGKKLIVLGAQGDVIGAYSID